MIRSMSMLRPWSPTRARIPSVAFMNSSVRRRDTRGKTHSKDLWIDARVWMIDGAGTENTIPLPIKSWLIYPLGEDTPEKGRPPPGGEEAEVVVFQPRGVGLMHTRHKPSNAHYTQRHWATTKYRIGNVV